MKGGLTDELIALKSEVDKELDFKEMFARVFDIKYPDYPAHKLTYQQSKVLEKAIKKLEKIDRKADKFFGEQ